MVNSELKYYVIAVRRNKNAIGMDEVDEATDRVLMGPAKTSRKIT